MYGELIDRLRGYANSGGVSWRSECEREAADALETLTAKVAQLEAERDGMREALDYIASSLVQAGVKPNPEWPSGNIEAALNKAISALKEQPHD